MTVSPAGRRASAVSCRPYFRLAVRRVSSPMAKALPRCLDSTFRLIEQPRPIRQPNGSPDQRIAGLQARAFAVPPLWPCSPQVSCDDPTKSAIALYHSNSRYASLFRRTMMRFTDPRFGRMTLILQVAEGLGCGQHLSIEPTHLNLRLIAGPDEFKARHHLVRPKAKSKDSPSILIRNSGQYIGQNVSVHFRHPWLGLPFPRFIFRGRFRRRVPTTRHQPGR